MARLESSPELDEATRISNSDLHLLEEVERQESHHRVETAAEAGVGRHHHPEVLPEVAGGTVVDSAGAQSSLRVPRVPGLAPEPGNHQGDEFFVTETLPQVAGRRFN